MEPFKVTDEEGRGINLLVCSIEALDEHVALQIKARGELLNQKMEWWGDIRKKYKINSSAVYFNRLDGSIHKSTKPKKKTKILTTSGGKKGDITNSS